jgi:hypothetical protein
MLKLDWQYIRVGTPVLVHEPADPLAPLRSGVVVIAQREAHRTRVGIRLTSTDESSAPIWPSANDVHLDPHGADDPCWRCDEAAAAHAATPVDASRS